MTKSDLRTDELEFLLSTMNFILASTFMGQGTQDLRRFNLYLINLDIKMFQFQRATREPSCPTQGQYVNHNLLKLKKVDTFQGNLVHTRSRAVLNDSN
jgi:hypothetical protein